MIEVLFSLALAGAIIAAVAWRAGYSHGHLIGRRQARQDLTAAFKDEAVTALRGHLPRSLAISIILRAIANALQNKQEGAPE